MTRPVPDMVLSRRHRLAIEVALLALVAYLAARGVSDGLRVALEGVPPAPAVASTAEPAAPLPLAEYAVIAERDIFNSGDRIGDARTGAAPPGDLRLWGVGLLGGEARAVIEDKATRRQELYRVGDTIGGQRVASIDWDRVSLTGSSGETTLTLSPPAATEADETPAAAMEAAAPPSAPRDERIRRTAENAFLVDRRELAGAVDNMSGLLTQLRAVAEVRDGRPAGFRLFQIRDGSLFARLGLRDGDVVQRVNGSPIADPAALLAFLDRLRTEPRVALDIVRKDASRTMVYDLR